MADRRAMSNAEPQTFGPRRRRVHSEGQREQGKRVRHRVPLKGGKDTRAIDWRPGARIQTKPGCEGGKVHTWVVGSQWQTRKEICYQSCRDADPSRDEETMRRASGRRIDSKKQSEEDSSNLLNGVGVDFRCAKQGCRRCGY